MCSILVLLIDHKNEKKSIEIILNLRVFILYLKKYDYPSIRIQILPFPDLVTTIWTQEEKGPVPLTVTAATLIPYTIPASKPRIGKKERSRNVAFDVNKVGLRATTTYLHLV